MHLRNRHLIDIINKKRRILPIVGVLGARQVGKSTLLRDIIGAPQDIPYLTLDRPEILRQAKKGAEHFILTQTKEFTKPAIIDEAHKAPELFDVLKVLADEKRARGIVFLTGSVDFSHAAGVRETLTGRLAISRLYPLTVAEISNKEFRNRWTKRSRKQHASNNPSNVEVATWIERGGMPAICRLKDRAERNSLIEEWLQSVCYRDLMQLKGARYDGAIARDSLELLAKNPEFSQADIAQELGIDSRIAGKHLSGLEALYVLTRVKPYKKRGGSGFDRYYLLDPAIASYLGADKKNLYTIFIINETLAQHEYGGLGKVALFHYSTRGNTKIDLVVESDGEATPIVISDRTEISSYQQRSLQAIIAKKLFRRIRIAAPVVQPLEVSMNISLEPYTLFA